MFLPSFLSQVTALHRLLIVGIFAKPIQSLDEAPFLLDWYDYLIKYGLDVEGVFRVSGNQEAIKDYKTRYNRGVFVFCFCYQSHATRFFCCFGLCFIRRFNGLLVVYVVNPLFRRCTN